MTLAERDYQWRVGRKVGRTIYRMLGEKPSDNDVLIGVMDTPELAQLAVAAYNTNPLRTLRSHESYLREGCRCGKGYCAVHD